MDRTGKTEAEARQWMAEKERAATKPVLNRPAFIRKCLDTYLAEPGRRRSAIKAPKKGKGSRPHRCTKCGHAYKIVNPNYAGLCSSCVRSEQRVAAGRCYCGATFRPGTPWGKAGLCEHHYRNRGDGR
jgi:hypothetical protein